ncbi:N-acetylmuramoyl-L-alanine amidase [bacterium]|nr:N-acetylmuramoyl-L-alanine amidase [bacterium]
MAHSSLASVYVPADPSNFTYGRTKPIRCITIHHMAGVMTAAACGGIFQRVGRNGSSHYGIGVNGEIGVYVEEENTAWTNSNWDSNCESITIETSNSSTGGDWPVSDASYNSLIRLVADIAKRRGLGKLIPGDNLTWHSLIASTYCPGDYLRARISDIADKANAINYPGPTPTPTSDFMVGDEVRPINLVDYNGTPLVSYHDSYIISSLSGDRAVLTTSGVVWAALNTNNLEMVNPAPRPSSVEWKDVPTTIAYINGETSLINLDDESVVKKLSGEFIYVQESKDGNYVRTSYSREHNQNYGVTKSALLTKEEYDNLNKPVIEVPVIEWKDVEPTTKHIIKTTNLINLETNEVVKELNGNFTYVQVSADGKYARTEYSKNKGLPYGVLLEALDDNLEPSEPSSGDTTEDPKPTPFPGKNTEPQIPGSSNSESSESILKQILEAITAFFTWIQSIFKKG